MKSKFIYLHRSLLFKRVFFASFFFAAFCINANAQFEDGNRDWLIKGNVTSFVDGLTFPTIRLSLEKKIYRFISLNTEGGIQSLYLNDTSGFTKLGGKGYKLNIESRFYLKRIMYNEFPYDLTGFYLGLQGFYRQNHYLSQLDYMRGTDTTVLTDYFKVKKKCYGVNVLAGYQFTKKRKRILFDFYSGIGMMYRDIKNTEREFNNNSNDYYADEWWLYNPHLKNLTEGSGDKFNFIIGFRIGFCIR